MFLTRRVVFTKEQAYDFLPPKHVALMRLNTPGSPENIMGHVLFKGVRGLTHLSLFRMLYRDDIPKVKSRGREREGEKEKERKKEMVSVCECVRKRDRQKEREREREREKRESSILVLVLLLVLLLLLLRFVLIRRPPPFSSFSSSLF